MKREARPKLQHRDFMRGENFCGTSISERVGDLSDAGETLRRPGLICPTTGASASRLLPCREGVASGRSVSGPPALWLCQLISTKRKLSSGLPSIIVNRYLKQLQTSISEASCALALSTR